MQQSTITAKGQVTIPKSIREHMGVSAGGRVRFFVRPDGVVMMLPVLPASALRGIVKYNGPPVAIEDMNESIRDRAVARDERSKRR